LVFSAILFKFSYKESKVNVKPEKSKPTNYNPKPHQAPNTKETQAGQAKKYGTNYQINVQNDEEVEEEERPANDHKDESLLAHEYIQSLGEEAVLKVSPRGNQQIKMPENESDEEAGDEEDDD